MVSLNPVVGVPLGAMPSRWQQVLEHDRIGRGSVGDYLNGGHPRRADGLLEELASRPCVALSRHEHVDHLPKLVDSAVDVAPAAGDLHIGLVHEPAIPGPVATGPGGFGQ